MTIRGDDTLKDLNGLTILGTEYSRLPFVFPRFDSDKPLRYIVFSAQGGGLAVEFFDQTGSENLDRWIEKLRAVNQGIEIYAESREQWKARWGWRERAYYL